MKVNLTEDPVSFAQAASSSKVVIEIHLQHLVQIIVFGFSPMLNAMASFISDTSAALVYGTLQIGHRP